MKMRCCGAAWLTNPPGVRSRSVTETARALRYYRGVLAPVGLHERGEPMKTAHSFVLACASALVACASQPPTTPTGAGTSALTSNQPATAQPATAQPATAQTTASATPQKVDVPYGYRRTTVDGQERFCKVEFYTGSRVDKRELCYTQAQLAAQQASTEAAIQKMQRDSGTALATYAGGYPSGAVP